MNSSVTEGIETKQVQLRTASPKQQPSILIKPGPPKTTLFSALVSLLTLLYSPLPLSLASVSIVFPSFITRHCHLSIPLFTAQRAENAWLSDLFPHKNHYIPPSSLSSSTNSVHSVDHPTKFSQRLHGYLFTLNLGLSSRRCVACGLKQNTGRRKAIMLSFLALDMSQKWMVYLFFIFHTLGHKQPTPRC